MSGAVGGDVAGAAIVLAAAAPVIAAAGLAYGVAKCTEFAVHEMSKAWQEHERLVEIDRQQAQIRRQRYEQYLAARADYDEAEHLLAATAGSTPIDPQPGGLAGPVLDLQATASGAELQEAIVDLRIAASRLRQAHAAASALAVARATAEALAHTATTQARAAETELQEAARAWAAEREAAAVDRSRRNRDKVAAAVARARAHVAAADAAKLSFHYEGLRRRAEEALQSLPPTVDAAAVERIQEWLMDLRAASSPAQASAAVSQIEVLVNRAAADAAERDQSRQLAACVVAALAGCESAVADEIRSRAQGYLAGSSQWDPELPEKARAELERIQQRLDDLMHAEVLAEALTELGYDVGPGFVVGGIDYQRHSRRLLAGFAHKDSWLEHALSVELDADHNRVLMQVVRQGDPAQESSPQQQQDDMAAEQSFCSDLPRIIEAAEDLGLHIKITRLVDPGEDDVPRVADIGVGRARRREESKPRQMERDIP